MKDHNPWLTMEMQEIAKPRPTSLAACLVPLLVILGTILACHAHADDVERVEKDYTQRWCVRCGEYYPVADGYCKRCAEEWKKTRKPGERE